MTQLSLIAVGRMKPGAQSDLAETYLKRLTNTGLGPLKLVEVEAKAQPTPELQKLREGEAIMEKIPKGAIVVALDERGKPLSSQEFAAWIAHRRDEGTQHIVFVIGGADGLDASIRSHANVILAFGEMTWPHMLARVMLLEQLYRAQQILAGHPYHRE